MSEFTEGLRELMARHEQERLVAIDGLDLAGYAGKWEAAQDREARQIRRDDTRLLPYWERVRLTFLELGGRYLSQRTPK